MTDNVPMYDTDVKQPPTVEDTIHSNGAMENYIDPKAEARILRKFDVRSNLR